AENSLQLISSAKFAEVQRFCAMTSHMWDGFWILGNEKALINLPASLQALLEAELQRAALLQRQDVDAISQSVPQELAREGMSFTYPDRSLFRARLEAAGFYRYWEGKFGPRAWRVLEDAVGGLT